MPPSRSGHRAWSDTPDETTPHMNAHIGGNQVTGLKSSSTAESLGSMGGAKASVCTMSVSLD